MIKHSPSLFLSSDINECTENTDNCSQLCNNTIGNYQCYCEDGYILDSDEHTCNGIYTYFLYTSGYFSRSYVFLFFLSKILMNVLRIPILVMVMPVVLTPLDPTTALVTLDMKETD